MLQLSGGRTLYYGKGDVFVYRIYASPLIVLPIAESAFTGHDNVIFAHNITFAVSGEMLLTSFTEGDNSHVVATDSMKNFILRHSAHFPGSTTEGYLAYISGLFLETYRHISAISITGSRIPFDVLDVPGAEGLVPSGLVYRRSNNEHASVSIEMNRTAEGARIVAHSCHLTDLQLIKVSGSTFYGFVRDEYTTLPESYDRPLFIFLNIGWKYNDVEHGLHAEFDLYVAAEQIRDLAHTVFHELTTPSIQYLVYRIGLRMLTVFPQLAEVHFESNNRTWETVIDVQDGHKAAVFTEPRPPYGFQGFSLTREDLRAAEESI